LSIFPPFFFKEIQIIIKRRIARPEAGYYVDLVRRLIIVLYENCTCLNGPKKKEKIAPNMLLFYANRSASHEYENIITDCIYIRSARLHLCFVGWQLLKPKKPKDIFQSLVYMYARSTVSNSLTSRCDAGKTCSLFIRRTRAVMLLLYHKIRNRILRSGPISFSSVSFICLFFSFLGFSFFLDGVGNSIRLLNWLMDNKSKKNIENLQCRLFRGCRPRLSDSSPKIDTHETLNAI
jgi:hypothetical protein